MVSKMRAQRIADQIREYLSEMLIYEVADPRLEGVSVTDVRVDRELAFASIYVSALEGSERSEEILDALGHAHGYLRSELARRIPLRTFPRLRFNWDPTFERAERIEQLIASIQSDGATESAAETSEGELPDQELTVEDPAGPEEFPAPGEKHVD